MGNEHINAGRPVRRKRRISTAGAFNGITLPCAAFVLEGIAEALMGGIKNDEDA